jgi:hypothetical protein
MLLEGCGCQDQGNYMIRENLLTIKRKVESLLEIEEDKIDSLLKDHPWAVDHISTSKDDIEEVCNFIHNNIEHSNHDDLKPGDSTSPFAAYVVPTFESFTNR